VNKLVKFLRARIDEDEAYAREPGDWNEYNPGDPADPARVLREVAAKQRIIDVVMAWRHDVNEEDCWYTCGAATEERDGGECCNDNEIGECGCGLEMRRQLILAPLALPYTDHPDYREEWRP
jgi:hypothetical protein